MNGVTLNVKGMTCQGCVASVTRVLKAVPGVSDVSVSLQAGTARVTYDAGQTPLPVLKAAIEDAGYAVTA
jgi:copper chaperone CopZ